MVDYACIARWNAYGHAYAKTKIKGKSARKHVKDPEGEEPRTSNR